MSDSKLGQYSNFTNKPLVFGQEQGKQGANSRYVDVGVNMFVPRCV